MQPVEVQIEEGKLPQFLKTYVPLNSVKELIIRVGVITLVCENITKTVRARGLHK